MQKPVEFLSYRRHVLTHVLRSIRISHNDCGIERTQRRNHIPQRLISAAALKSLETHY